MNDLKDALDVLYDLTALRDRAKELREWGRLGIKEITSTGDTPGASVEIDPPDPKLRERWLSGGNSVEAALLVKVQNHRDMSDDDATNAAAEAAPDLKKRLCGLDLPILFPDADPERQRPDAPDPRDNNVPVLVAARAMQSLVSRSETVFSTATMLCYYRIVRELYTAAPPDWTIGAARAGVGGKTSAFITGECIRAIFAFEDAMKRTVEFFERTHTLLKRHEQLKAMIGMLTPDAAGAGAAGGARKPPLSEWADRAIERMWLDWYISTNTRRGEMALHSGSGVENGLLPSPGRADMESVGAYLGDLKLKLSQAVARAHKSISDAKKDISSFRRKAEGSFFKNEETDDGYFRRAPVKEYSDEPNIREEEEREFHKKERRYDRHESAHKFATSVVERAMAEVGKAQEWCHKSSLAEMLDDFSRQFRDISRGIHKVLEPAKRYIRTVLQREVAHAALGRFDAGELVFAAASFGAITDWKPNEFLTRACALLLKELPEGGRMPTTRPFHSTPRGYRMLPIGCEMTRSLAQLLQRTNYEFEPQLVRRMLNIFEEGLIPLDPPTPRDKTRRVAWNFDGAPDPTRPCVWVTVVSVLALDRIVRMVNERVNSIIFKYFEVIRPEKPHTSFTLDDLVYPDYGLSTYRAPAEKSIAIRLEQMRAHVTRVALPDSYTDGGRERVFSAILYGPPGTGKTTLIESLALSSNAPLIRLSPSDLVVKGQEEIEGRARVVFEALSMLTKAVIIFDEFEEVVGHNKPDGSEKPTDKIYDFLRRGMLPKLVKLHDAAKKQSLVYCLATNHLSEISLAAKRTGRFDYHLPVYNPDPLARAGTLLYRLQAFAAKSTGGGLMLDDDMLGRFVEVIAATSGKPASELGEVYFKLPEWAMEEYAAVPAAAGGAAPAPQLIDTNPYFTYILKGGDTSNIELGSKLSEEEMEKLRKKQEEAGKGLSPDERAEFEWLAAYESQIENSSAGGNTAPLSCLIGPP